MGHLPSSLTLSDLLIKAIRRHGDRVALRFGEVALSYNDLDARSDRLAAFLAANGLGCRDAVALHLRNCPEYAIADLAILKLGAVKIPLNELMTPNEVAYCLWHSEARALIAHASLPEPRSGDANVSDFTGLRISVPDAAPSRSGQPAWRDALDTDAPAVAIDPGPDDPALIAYTGGTTGLPKGVRHLQCRLAINILAHVVCGDVRSDEVMLLSTPLPHSAGFHMLACFLQGGEVVLATKFDPADFLALAGRRKATWTFAVPTMLYRLLDMMEAQSVDAKSLRTILYGAAPMGRERLAQALERFGPILIQIYGQTECPNLITTLTKEDHLDDTLLASCGRAVPFLDVAVRGADGDCAPGAIGEVAVRAPYLLADYHRNEEATRTAIVDDWLMTGDLAYQDARGYVFLVDRAKDMIITGGMNVYSIEVETALRQHEVVRDVAVIGVPDPDWGERVEAFVVPARAADEEELRSFARERLSAYKIPKRVHFVDGLPLTRYGKIDKKALRASHQASR